MSRKLLAHYSRQNWLVAILGTRLRAERIGQEKLPLWTTTRATLKIYLAVRSLLTWNQNGVLISFKTWKNHLLPENSWWAIVRNLFSPQIPIYEN